LFLCNGRRGGEVDVLYFYFILRREEVEREREK